MQAYTPPYSHIHAVIRTPTDKRVCSHSHTYKHTYKQPYSLRSSIRVVIRTHTCIGACIELEGGVLECTGTDRQKSATGEFWAGHTSAGQILRTPQKGIIWDLFA